jgi:mannitol/fructose-specific phosphotransferase system IIA component
MNNQLKNRAIAPSQTRPLPRVGKLLVSAGFVTVEAIESGLARQRLENRKLGELIVDLGMLEQADLDAVLAIQNDLRAGHAEDIAAVVGSRLGAILVASNCVSKSELDRALTQLKDSEDRLGVTLIREGALGSAQLSAALVLQGQFYARRSERFKLGRMLVESGVVSEQALQEAIVRQKVNGKRLGETLLELGAISKPALDAGLSRQRRLIAAAIAAISLMVGGGMPEEAAAATTRMRVSARILTHVSFRSMKTPDQVSITAANIA